MRDMKVIEYRMGYNPQAKTNDQGHVYTRDEIVPGLSDGECCTCGNPVTHVCIMAHAKKLSVNMKELFQLSVNIQCKRMTINLKLIMIKDQ